MENVARVVSEPVYLFVDLDNLHPAAYNARRFHENMSGERSASFLELVNSIKEKGILQPLVVRDLHDGSYEIIAGERRYRACTYLKEQMNILVSVPVAVYDCDQQTAIEMSLIENALREDLTLIEAAKGYQAYIEAQSNPQEAISYLSIKTGLTEQSIREQVSFLKLPQIVLDKFEEKSLSLQHLKLLARLPDEAKILEKMTACLSARWSAKMLKDDIEGDKVLLKVAKFDTNACQGCQHNTSLQGALFVSGGQADGQCTNPPCFEEKQGKFFADNWNNSKGREVCQTSGFSFSNRLDVDKYQIIPVAIPTSLPERCFSCPECRTVVDRAGAVAPGKERVCMGAKACFDELYVAPARKAAQKKQEEAAAVVAAAVPAPRTTTDESDAEDEAPEQSGKKKATKAKATVATKEPVVDEKKAQKRSDEYREVALRHLLPTHLSAFSSSDDLLQKLMLGLLRNAYSGRSSNLKANVIEAAQTTENPMDLLRQEVLHVVEHYRNSYGGGADLAFLDQVAQMFDLDYAKVYQIDEKYVGSMTRAEIMAMGEEPQMALWADDLIVQYRDREFGKKGWLSLKKTELIDCIFKSGTDLIGRVPSNLLQTCK